MAGVGPHMGIMEAVEARGTITPEVVTVISDKGLASATGIVKEIIIAPIAVIHWAVVSVVITVVVVRWPISAGARRQCKQRGSTQNHFQFTFHDELLDRTLIKIHYCR